MMGRHVTRRSAEFLLVQIRSSEESAGYLIPSFIISVCAGIEGLISDTYINHFFQHFGMDYKKYVRPFLFMNHHERLRLLFPLISGYRFALNEDSERVKALLRLFETRNRLVHIKHHKTAATIVEHEHGSDILFDNPDYTDFYSFGRDSIKMKDLRAALQLLSFYENFFWEINWHITRKHFNPRDVLVRVVQRI